MRILGLEPYFGGSHASFLRGWWDHSRHGFTCLSLPGHHWKWRMRHAAVTFAAELADAGHDFDAVWCSSMLDLAAFRGLAPAGVAALPAVVYFHENQLAYPNRVDDPRDHHFGITQMNAALAAAASGGCVLWNSAYNRDTFLRELRKLLKKMPGETLPDVPERIAAVSEVVPPGLESDCFEPRAVSRHPGPLRIVWAARWEHDKDPAMFFEALGELEERGVAFRISVLGEQFRDVPPEFAAARERFADRIDAWGYLPERADYLAALRAADVFVSTAQHEFFGLSAMEAAAAGCFPVLPDRLAYPELFADKQFFYDGTHAGIVAKLTQLAEDGVPASNAIDIAKQYAWENIALQLDDAMSRCG